MKRLLFLMALLMETTLRASSIQSGPIIGYATMAEVLIKVQTTEAAEVIIAYSPEDSPREMETTEPVRTERKRGYVADCVLDRVRAGTTYLYRVLVDGEPQDIRYREGYQAGGPIPLKFTTPPNWRFREEGHDLPDFTLAFGSCAYQNEPGGYDRLNGDPYGGDYRIFESIYEKKPVSFIWLGDNVYYREPDWTSRTGMIHRWTHDRSNPYLRPLLATTPQYATWDDHDFGPNDATREFWNKELATEIFGIFNGNPSAGLPGIPGIFTFFNYGDVNVVLLDNRTHRTVTGLESAAFGGDVQLLGKAQVDWLVETLRYRRNQARSSYPSTFNLICMGSQVLSPWGRDSYQHYPEEWQYLMDRLVEEEIHNVIFVTGDVHFGEMSRLVYSGGGRPGTPGRAGSRGVDTVFYEVTTSPLTAGSWSGPEASENPHRLDIFPGEADRAGQRNFATLSFEGPLNQRRAVVRYYDSDGRLLNQKPGAPAGEVTPESIIEARNTNLGRLELN